MGVCLTGVHLIYESSSRAGHGWRESLYRHQGCFKSFWLWATRPSGCWSPLERAPCSEKLPKPRQQLCIQSGTRAHYLNYLHSRWARRGKKRRQSDWVANQIDRKVMDRQVIDRLKTDRQVETRPMSAGTQADHAAS